MSGNNIIVTGTGLEMPPVIGDLYSSFSFTSATPGPQTLATGLPGIIITRLFVSVDVLTTQATAGNVVIQFKDNTANVVIGQIAVYVPTAAPTLNMAQIGSTVSSGTGYWYRSRAASSVIQVSVISGGPLTAGSIRVAINYALIAQDT